MLTRGSFVRFLGGVLAALGGASTANLFTEYHDWRILFAGLLLGFAGIIFGADDGTG